MPSDPASSIFLSLPAFLSSVPSVCPSSDYTPRQPDANAHLTFRQVPTPDIILFDALSSKFFSTFHTFQSDTLSLPGGTGLDNTDRPLPKCNNFMIYCGYDCPPILHPDLYSVCGYAVYFSVHSVFPVSFLPASL